MATEERIITITMEIVPEPPSSEKEEPKVRAEKTKKAKESKPKKAFKPRSPSSHPTYSEMIKDAIVSLKEKNGSSQYAIAKFIEGKHKQLPSNFKKLLLQNLKKNVASRKLAKVKGSFKISLATTKPKSKTATEVKEVMAKPSGKPKAKSAVKPKIASKAKAVTAKPKVAASKNKAAVKPKPKEKPRKVAKTTPRKKVSAAKPALKKVAAVKSVKTKSIKSPAKKVSIKREGRK